MLGTALEGETILVVAGYLARRGSLHLPYVIAAAMFGTFIGEQVFVQLGRQSGKAFLARRPLWQAKADRVRNLLDRHRIALVVGFRFMYGLRIGGAGYIFGRVLQHRGSRIDLGCLHGWASRPISNPASRLTINGSQHYATHRAPAGALAIRASSPG